jgi:hypothetical protein
MGISAITLPGGLGELAVQLAASLPTNLDTQHTMLSLIFLPASATQLIHTLWAWDVGFSPWCQSCAWHSLSSIGIGERMGHQVLTCSSNPPWALL